MTPLRASLVVTAALAASSCSHAPAKPDNQPLPTLRHTTVVRAPVPITAPSPPAATTPEHAIYFDLDAALVREDARSVLDQLARRLQLDPTAKVRIEGNCDERGTTEYNLALGDRRARAAKEYLRRLGIADDRIEVATYGSERPRNRGHDEAAWSENRRDDLRVQ